MKSWLMFSMSLIFGIFMLVGNLVNAKIENPYLIMNPENVLRATLSFSTDVPTKSLAVLSSSEHMVTVHSTQGLTNHHQMEIIGLHPQERYIVTIGVVDEAGNTIYDRSLQLETSALPEYFPPLKITVNNPAKMQPGITFFDIRRWVPTLDTWGMIIAIDEQGKVVWYHEDVNMTAVSQLQNQNLLYLIDGNAIEMDMLGNKKHIWTSSKLTPPISKTFHHDVIEMPSGNLLTLIKDIRTIDGFTDKDGEQVSRSIRGDAIVEFTPEGYVVNQWNVFDMLDPHRVKKGLDSPLTKEINWTHANSVFYDARDNSIMVSLRAQDWIIKFSRETGELLWRFGEDGDFSMLGTGQWPFHHHAARFSTDGSLVMYDNGNERTGIEDANFYSRAVQYQLDTSSSDPTQWTATQLWEFRDSEDFFSPFLCEVEHLANGNFLITDGGRVADPKVSHREDTNQKWARIVEVMPNNPATKVFELMVRDETSDTGYSMYRSERLANLTLANLGVTVNFANSSQVPTGMDLTELLPILSTDSEINQPASVDLSVSLFGNDVNILEAINTLPMLNLPNWTLTQDSTQGYLQMDIENLRFAAQPWKISHTLDNAMLQINTAQTLRLITKNGIEVLAQPAVQHPKTLQTALRGLGLPDLVIQPNGNLKIFAYGSSWFSARPDLASTEIAKEVATGLFVDNWPVALVFEAKDGKKRQQSLFPAPAYMDELYLAAKRVEFNQGILSFQLLGKSYQGMLDYEVFKVDKIGNLQVSPILDDNNNETGDYLLTYPNGDGQKLFAL